jgi:hypothetical protein
MSDDGDCIGVFLEWNDTIDPVTEEPFPPWVSALCRSLGARF